MFKVLTKWVLQHQISCQALFPLEERFVFSPLVSIQEQMLGMVMKLV